MQKSVTFNKFFNITIISGILLFIACISLPLEEEDKSITAFLIVVSVFLVVCPLFATPCFYVFDSEGVTIYYVFYSKERYLWKNIYRIQSTTDSSSSSHLIFDLIFSGIFEIGGQVEGKKKFYMHGHISKGFRAKKLIEKYWDGEITKDFEFGKKKSKNRNPSKFSTDEISSAERALRSHIRDWQIPLQDRAENQCLEFRSTFLYITDDFDEFKSRPKTPYTYIYEVEICRQGETEEEKIAYFSAELLYVRIGRNAYKYVENKYVNDELQDITAEVEKIFSIGIDAYLEEE